jgi:hypothetical protein
MWTSLSVDTRFLWRWERRIKHEGEWTRKFCQTAQLRAKEWIKKRTWEIMMFEWSAIQVLTRQIVTYCCGLGMLEHGRKITVSRRQKGRSNHEKEEYL